MPLSFGVQTVKLYPVIVFPIKFMALIKLFAIGICVFFGA
jgi:hypothetical protein